MTKYQHLEVEIDQSIATIWLNRPDKLNALSADMWADIPRAVESLNADDAVRVIVIAGRGRSFTVGIDIEMLAGFAPNGPSQAASNLNLYGTIRGMQATTSSLAESPKPAIAAVHGHCLGAGLDLITACDIRLASTESTFGIRETRMGLVADVGTLQRLPGIVGAGHVAELAFTGKDIDATRASEIGLVNSVHDELMESVHDLAAEIAANSPLVLSGIKSVLGANRGRTVDEALDYVAQWNAAYLQSNDLLEAMNAYLEKRNPEFTGE